MVDQVLQDFDHVWGGDIKLSPTGDIATVSGFERSRQRVLRRLMTIPREYIWELLPEPYGGGVPAQIGRNLDLAKLKALIGGQMLLEESVAQDPAPTVLLRPIAKGVAATVNYLSLPDKQPVSLQFNLER